MARNKGVFVRPRLDWVLDKLGAGGALTAAGGAGIFSQVSLFNDATPSVAFAVYFIYIGGATNTAVVNVTVGQGSFGAKIRAGQSIISNGPAVGGSIFGGTNATMQGNILLSFFNGNLGQQVFSVTPIYILASGYSLICTSTTSNQAISGSFLWAPL